MLNIGIMPANLSRLNCCMKHQWFFMQTIPGSAVHREVCSLSEELTKEIGT